METPKSSDVDVVDGDETRLDAEEKSLEAQEETWQTLIRRWIEHFWSEEKKDDDEENDDDDDETDFGLRRKSTKRKKKVGGDRPVIVRVPKPEEEQGEGDHETTSVGGSEDQRDRFSGDGGFSRGEDIVVVAPPSRAESMRSSVASDDIAVKRPKCYYVAREILTSERTYFKGLLLVEKAFHGAIKTYNLSNKTPILTEPILRTIFSNVGELYEMHKGLMIDLEKRLRSWDENPKIGDILRERAPYFRMYSTYSIAFEAAQTTLAHWQKKSPELADIVKRVESTKPCKSMPITSFMLMPIQRIPRYELLLQNYVKNLDPDSSDLIDAEEALKIVSQAALHMDEQCKKLDNFQKVIQIQRTLVGKETIVAPGREFVAKGPVTFIDGNQSIPSIFFLFSDILVVARNTKQGQYRVQFKIEVSDMKVQDRKTEVLPNGFSITEQKLYVFEAKGADEKEKWLEVFEEAIKRLLEKRSSLTTASFPTNTLSTLLRKKKLKAQAEAAEAENRPRLQSDEVDSDRLKFMYDSEIGLHAFCQMSGYLKQKSRVYELWRKKWFELSGLRLFSFKSHDENEDPIGCQPLTGCSVSLFSKQPLCFVLTTPGGLTCVMNADSEHDLKKWMEVIALASEVVEE